MHLYGSRLAQVVFPPRSRGWTVPSSVGLSLNKTVECGLNWSEADATSYWAWYVYNDACLYAKIEG